MNITKSINYTNLTYSVVRDSITMEHRTMVIPRKLSMAAALREIKKKEVLVFIPKSVKVEYVKVTYLMPLDTFLQYATVTGTMYPNQVFVKGIKSDNLKA